MPFGLIKLPLKLMKLILTKKRAHCFKLLVYTTIGFLSSAIALEGSSIVENSPFLSPHSNINLYANNKTSKQTRKIDDASKRFSLLGIVKIGRNYLFSIHDSKTNQSKWLSGGDSSHEFVILSYDAALNRIDYSWNEKTGSMTITQANGAPIPLAIENRKTLPIKEKTTTAKINASTKESTNLVTFDKNIDFRKLSKIEAKTPRSLASNNYRDRFASTNILQTYEADQNKNNVEIQKEFQRVRRHINKEKITE